MEFFWKVLGPYFFVRFMLTPLPFLAFDVAVGGNGVYAKTAMYSLVFAEILTNIHSFIIIATNHAGDDLYRFNCHCTPRSCTFFLRQVISSVNYPLGKLGPRQGRGGVEDQVYYKGFGVKMFRRIS
jgi:hypothetical protein